MDKINIEDFKRKVEQEPNMNIIDVRPDRLYNAGHVPGAMHMPLDTIEDNLDQLNKDTHYYTYCHDGVGAAKSAEILEQNGFNVTRVEQGLPEYTGQLETAE